MTSTPEFCIVAEHDTLQKIAEKNSTTVKELCLINGIKNPNKIKIGQKIALKKEVVCGVQFQLLDKDSNPLRNTKVKIQYGNKEIISNTSENGIPEKIVTDSPMDVVSIYIERVGGDWKRIMSTTSDWGNKLVTLISPKLKITTKTQSHPQDFNGRPLPDKEIEKKKVDKDASVKSPAQTSSTGKTQSHFSKNKGDAGIKSVEVKDSNGLPIAKITNDQAHLPFLDLFQGGKMVRVIV